MNKPQIVLLVGNIGSGKSTWVEEDKKWQREQPAGVVSLDETRYIIGVGEYVFNLETEPLVFQMNKMKCEAFMITKRNYIIIDETNMTHKHRRPWIELAKKYNYRVVAIVFKDLGEEIHVTRRLRNPHGNFSKEVWSSIYQRKQREYQVPSPEEGIDLIVRA